MIHPYFWRWLLGSMTALAILILAFIWIVDPYGVSPVRVSLPGINTFKTKRLDIDRLIKPYEVWWHQPRTVFLGTSRIHQSIDPTVLGGTEYAPAYNASIPASTLSENAAHLEQFFRLNGNIRHVFVEAFLYSFIFPQQQTPSKSISEFAQNASSLLFSLNAVLASFQTIAVNHSRGPTGAFVAPGGFWTPPKSFHTKDTFSAKSYIDEIMQIHKNIPDMILQPTSLEALDRIVELCRKNNAELHVIMTPNYPWDDYRLLSLGYWPLLDQWLKRLGTYDNVISFSQYNDLLAEPAGPNMIWWNDPIHPSERMGRLVLEAIAGQKSINAPPNLVRHVTPATAEAIIAERRAGLEDWIMHNQDFTSAFDRAKVASGAARRSVR